jgi:hypothetical protein
MLRRLLLALALAIGPANGLAESASAPALRGPERPAPDPKPLSPLPTPRPPPNDLVTGLLANPAPVEASGVQKTAGECRRACARELYFCSAGRDVEDCNSAWTRCVAHCSQAASSSP